MKTIRTREQDLQEMLANMKVGDSPLYDMETNYEICRVPNGLIYRREYEGICFVPYPYNEGGIMEQKAEPKKAEDKTVAKVEPKATVKKTEPKKMIKK